MLNVLIFKKLLSIQYSKKGQIVGVRKKKRKESTRKEKHSEWTEPTKLNLFLSFLFYFFIAFIFLPAISFEYTAGKKTVNVTRHKYEKAFSIVCVAHTRKWFHHINIKYVYSLKRWNERSIGMKEKLCELYDVDIDRMHIT